MLSRFKWMALAAAALWSAQAVADITVYSGQHKSGSEAVAQAFTKATGIKTTLRQGSSEQMAGQLVEEGERTPADVFWAEQITPMLSLSEIGLLAKLPSDVISATSGAGYESVPLAENGDWVATSGRARVVVYNPDLISKDELADSVLDYAKPEWEGKVGYVPTSGAFLEQVIGIAKLEGEDAALAWLEGLKKYQKSYAKNAVAMTAVERGAVPLALINNYYWYNMAREAGSLDNVKSRLDYIGHQDPGAMMTYAAIAVLEHSGNKDEAMQFVEFVVSQEGQQVFADLRAEYPLRSDVSSSFELYPYAKIEPPTISITTFDDKENALHLLEKAGLK
ncbi:MAG: extracellular solute-binding protein [Ottowia sp.]|nr:extracellular solute-binding protein [Ottowia sp.]